MNIYDIVVKDIKNEDGRVEYKIDIPEKQNKLKAEIVSLLNSNGGEIHLWINDGAIDKSFIELNC